MIDQNLVLRTIRSLADEIDRQASTPFGQKDCGRLIVLDQRLQACLQHPSVDPHTRRIAQECRETLLELLTFTDPPPAN